MHLEIPVRLCPDMVASSPLEETNLELNRTNAALSDFLCKKGSLLILGGEASGKSITLFQLAKKFLIDATENSLNPVPIVLDLLSWANNRKNLRLWIIDEVRTRYRIKWSDDIKLDNIVLLLDNLHEIPESHEDNLNLRTACIKEINDFYNDYPNIHIVVCCRPKEYRAALKKLNFRSAIQLENLNQEAITRYFNLMSLPREIINYFISLMELNNIYMNPLFSNVIVCVFKSGSYKLDINMEHSEMYNYLIDKYFTLRMKDVASQYKLPWYLRFLNYLRRIAFTFSIGKQT